MLSTLSRHADALEVARAAVRVEPESALAHIELARAAREMGEIEVEARAIEAALELDPTSAHVLQRAAISARSRGDFAQSQTYLEHALTQEAGDSHLLHSLGETALERGDHSAAIAAFRRALAGDPRNAGFHHSLGFALIEAERLDEAISAFDAGMAAFPEEFAFVQGKLYALHQSQRYAEKKALARERVRERPDSAEAWSALAWCCNDVETLDEAVDAARRAVELEGTPERHETLSRMLHSACRYADAVSAAKQAVELAPGDESHWDALFWAQHAVGDVAGAQRAAEKIVELAPQQTTGYLALLRLEVTRHDRADARVAEATQRLTRQLPHSPDTWSHLGSHHFVLGERVAIAHCQAKLRELLDTQTLSEKHRDEAERAVHELEAYLQYLCGDLPGARASMLKSCVGGAPDDCSQICFIGLLAVREGDVALARRLQQHERWGARRGRRCLDPMCPYGLMLDDALRG